MKPQTPRSGRHAGIFCLASVCFGVSAALALSPTAEVPRAPWIAPELGSPEREEPLITVQGDGAPVPVAEEPEPAAKPAPKAVASKPPEPIKASLKDRLAARGSTRGGDAVSGAAPADPWAGAVAADAPSDRHNAVNFRKCKRCLFAYEKALARVRKDVGSATFAAKMICAWLFLADGRYPNELQDLIKAACKWDQYRKGVQHGQNWYPALAGLFLVEAYKYYPTQEIHDQIYAIIANFVNNQERTGGWFKWFEGAYKDRLDYAVKDLGMIDAITYGFLYHARALGFKVPDATLQKADACMDKITTTQGISYGTPAKWGDPTGGRGGFCIQGLSYAQMFQHKIWTTYVEWLPKAIPKMDQGHHVGGLHCLAVTLGCRTLGPVVYQKLIQTWLDKLIDKQDADGGVYIGDDGAAGGENGLLKGNIASTSSFALMILLQDATLLHPKRLPRLPAPVTSTTAGGKVK